MSKLKWFGLGLLGVLLALQLVPVERSNPPVTTAVSPPPRVAAVLHRACFDCHSHETRWPWYSRIAPASWIVAHDVHEGRDELNFSDWDGYMPRIRREKIEKVWAKVAADEMPPRLYRMAHSTAALSPQDRQTLQTWSQWAGPSGVQSLVDAELAFAADAEAHGVRRSFIAFMADDAVIFRPHPVNAQDWLGEQPDTGGSLLWRPVWADLSAAGDMGYTAGPWEYRGADGAPSRHGQFVSVWRRRPEVGWKVVLDAGISHPRADATRGLALPDRLPLASRGADDGAARTSLLDAERTLDEAARREGMRSAYASLAHRTIRVYREGRLPSIGGEAVDLLLRDHGAVVAWEPTFADVAASGDLGYVYGSARADAADEHAGVFADHHYVRIWRRDESGAWRIVVDVLLPLDTE